MFRKEEEEVNKDCAEKPVGFSKDKKRILSNPTMELDIPSGCYVSVEHPCESASLGARDFFEKYGYLVIDGLFNYKVFYENPPSVRGQINYYGREDKYSYDPDEKQVEGSLARYNHPRFKFVHSQARIKIEKIIGQQLYNTYYYDRFYFKGQKLYRHTDRDACEISLTYQISSNSKKPWPICFETPAGEEKYVNLKDGQAVLYKGIERDHWREPLESRYSFAEKLKNKLLFKKDDTYHHQIFFHYVRANGEFAHCCGDNR